MPFLNIPLETETKRCSGCKELIPVTEFYRRSGRASGYSTFCRSCVAFRNHHNGRHVRFQCLVQYSGGAPRCNCCGETNTMFLCIDHINGGGTAERKVIGAGTPFFRWLQKSNYPSGYQVLCHNCNMAKGFYGECPHQSAGNNNDSQA